MSEVFLCHQCGVEYTTEKTWLVLVVTTPTLLRVEGGTTVAVNRSHVFLANIDQSYIVITLTLVSFLLLGES